ncbi:MAG: hypothetical protein ACRDH5_16460, partial [bacterium]
MAPPSSSAARAVGLVTRFAAACVLFPVSLRAQGIEAIGSIEITPDGTTLPMHLANTSGAQWFWVKNTYTIPVTVDLICVGRVNVTCTGTDITEFTLGPNAQIEVEATYAVGEAGTGRLVLQAS